jgi:predicted ThiF/HesA family dinucleotide-utilizing enzyme
MKSVVVVGVGALGSHAVQLLRSTGAAIKIVDFDRVEQKNVQSQFHGKPHVGKTKVEALKQTMQFLFGAKVETNPNRLTAENAKELLGGADLVLDCLDNGDGRRIVQVYVRANAIPCVHGALAPGGEFGRVVWDEAFAIDDESNAGAATCEDGEHLPFIAITSSYLAHAVAVFLRGGIKLGFAVSPAGAIRI